MAHHNITPAAQDVLQALHTHLTSTYLKALSHQMPYRILSHKKDRDTNYRNHQYTSVTLGTSTGHTNAPAYPHSMQVTLPEDSAASATLQETALLTSIYFGNMEVEFEGESNRPLELAMAAATNAEDDPKSVEHMKHLDD